VYKKKVMDKANNNRGSSGGERDMTTNRTEQHSSIPNDLPDSPHDQERLQGEETTIDLPDVKDIPGQEFVHAPPIGMMADTTISSDDEEGEGLFDDASNEDDEDADLKMGTEGNVSRQERQTLAATDLSRNGDDDRLRRASMDNTDFQGEPLNESSFGAERSGSDLDIPEETDETTTSAMGDGDEENKYYSLGSDDNDNVTEGTP
jgi:hypothetical protein